MESLAPPLRCLLTVRTSVENGETVASGIRKYVQHDKTDFSRTVARWLFEYEQKVNTSTLVLESSHRRVLLDVLKAGLEGQAIHPRLVALEEEIIGACHSQIQRELDLLPFKMMIPLLFFQFPAFLILVFGPLLNYFEKSLGLS